MMEEKGEKDAKFLMALDMITGRIVLVIFMFLAAVCFWKLCSEVTECVRICVDSENKYYIGAVYGIVIAGASWPAFIFLKWKLDLQALLKGKYGWFQFKAQSSGAIEYKEKEKKKDGGK